MKEEWEASGTSTTEKDGVRWVISTLLPEIIKPEKMYETMSSKTLDISQQNKVIPEKQEQTR